MISISNLSKQYGDKVVLDVPELEMNRGESVGLVGNNGAGKTTLISLILDLIQPTSGEVRINGIPVQQDRSWKNFTGAYLDDNFLIEFLTPDEYFEFIARTHGWNEADLENFLQPYLPFLNDEVVGQKKYIRNLSKGNRKKTGIVASMIGDPDLLILDEPFANLDPSTQIRLKELFNNLPEEKLVFISSHDLSHITDVCDRILILEKGKLVKDKPKTEATLKELTEYFGSIIEYNEV
jgi:ABC-2 type transport system ATP-binding protein